MRFVWSGRSKSRKGKRCDWMNLDFCFQIEVARGFEALSQLDDLNRFFQSMSISTLAFPHTSSHLSIQDLVDTISQGLNIISRSIRFKHH